MGIPVEEVKAQIVQTIPAPKGSKDWPNHPDGKTHRYWAYFGYPDWNEAKEFCELLGGHLVTITSEEEQVFVKNNVFPTAPDVSFWIGIQNSYGKWNQWVSGELLGQYANWNNEYPISFGDDTFAAISGVTRSFTLNPDTSSSKVIQIEKGKWITETIRSMSEGWFICEWEYD